MATDTPAASSRRIQKKVEASDWSIGREVFQRHDPENSKGRWKFRIISRDDWNAINTIQTLNEVIRLAESLLTAIVEEDLEDATHIPKGSDRAIQAIRRIHPPWAFLIEALRAIPGIKDEKKVLKPQLPGLDPQQNWNLRLGYESLVAAVADIGREIPRKEIVTVSINACKCLRYGSRMLQSCTGSINNQALNQTPVENGPFGFDGFRWNEKVVRGFKGKPFALTSFLWPDKAADFKSLAGPVWNEEAWGNAELRTKVPSVACDATKFFEENGFPFRLRCAASRHCVELVCTETISEKK